VKNKKRFSLTELKLAAVPTLFRYSKSL